MIERRTDPATGRDYTVDTENGTTAWVTATKPSRRFLWIFLAVQGIFLAWLVFAIVASRGNATDCGDLSQSDCNDARNALTGIGVFFILLIWIFVDFLIGVGYVIYRLTRRP